MTIIGSAHVQIRADDKLFESDVRKATAKIKNVTIQLKADVDLAKASKKIRDLRYRITSKDAVLKVDANVDKAEEKLARLLAKFIDKKVEFNAVANTKAANTALGELRERYATSRVNMTAQADTKAAEAALRFASRSRRSTISAMIDPQTRAAVQGLFNTITGTISAAKIRATLSGVAAHFEGIAVKAAVATTAVLALSSALLTTGANILSIAGDITQVIGLTALIPTAIGSMVSIIVASKMAWKGFAEAMSDDAKKAEAAMAKLPPQAQAAAKALKGVYTEIQKPVQGAFWEAMDTALQDAVRDLLPSLKEGLSDVGRSLGSVTREVMLAFGRMGDGTLLNMLKNLGVGLDNMAPGFGALIDAFAILGETGSTYLPRFGEWTTELAVRFKGFIEEAEKTGKITRWIDEGIQRLQEMGSIVKSTAGFFSGLTAAARAAGAPGLTEMAESMRNIRDIVNAEPFQSKLITILEGARRGAEKLGDGFANLTDFIGESATSLGIFLDKAGEIGGLTFDNIRNLFDGTNLGNGLYEALDGLEDLLVTIEPGIRDLGDALGTLGEIGGEVIRNLGPGLNQLFDTLDKVLDEIKDGVIAVIPIFNEFIQALMVLVQGPIVALADGIGNVLKAFSLLPDGIQTVLMSLGLFLAIMPKLVGAWDNFGRKMNDTSTSFGRNMTNIRDGFGTATTAGRNFAGTGTMIASAFAATGEGIKRSMGSVFDAMPAKAQGAVAGVKGAFSEFGAGFKSGLSLDNELSTVRSGLQNVADRTRDTFRSMGDDVKGQFARFRDHIAPADGAVRTMVSNVKSNFAEARTAISGLATHATTAMGNATRQIGSGLQNAAGGLMGFLGGPWGLAIAGATAALGLFAAEQAKTERLVANLSATLDEQSGAWTDATRKMFSQELLDQNANWWDDLARSGRRNMEELVRDTGMNIKEVVDKLSDPSGRDAFIENWRKIRDAAGDGKDVSDELAASVGMTKKQLEGLSQTDLDNLVRQFEKSGKAATEAEKRIEILAQATGKNKVEAAALASNYDTLRSATSSLDDKFDAFKQNLDITTGGFQELKNAGRDFAEGMLDMTDGVVNLGSKYGGLEEGTKKLSDAFQQTLFNADGTFSTASRGAIDFSKEMGKSRDAVLKAGIAEFQSLRQAGVELPEAQAKALAAMEPNLKTMRDNLGNLGFDVGEVNQIMGQLGLDPDKLRGALELDTADAEGAAMRVQIMLSAIGSKNWSVALSAQSDEVKNELLNVEAYRKAYESGGWEAVIGLIDEAGPKIDDFMIKLAEAKGDKTKIKAILEAEAPGAKVVQKMTEDVRTLNKEHPVKKLFEADNKISVPAGIAGQAIKDLNNQPDIMKRLEAMNLTGTAVEDAKATMGGLPNVTRDLFGRDSTAPAKDQAQITMNTLKDVVRNLEAANMAEGGRGAAQATMNSLKDVIRKLEAENATVAGKNSAQGTIDLLKGKSVNLEANDRASGVVDSVNNKKISDKSFSIVGVLSGVSDAVRNMLGMYNGGILGGNGVQKFANGGFSGIKKPVVKAYANGGTEKHVAQIARGAWPVRVWAEPETGGEAYVPLHPSKRVRSLKILEEVASMFGYSLAKTMKFANGGLLSMQQSTPASLSVSSSSGYVTANPSVNGGNTTIINQTINPSQGLSEKQIAQASAVELFWELQNKQG